MQRQNPLIDLVTLEISLHGSQLCSYGQIQHMVSSTSKTCRMSKINNNKKGHHFTATHEDNCPAPIYVNDLRKFSDLYKALSCGICNYFHGEVQVFWTEQQKSSCNLLHINRVRKNDNLFLTLNIF